MKKVKPEQATPVPAELISTLVVLVIGENHCWGKAPTLEEALKLAWRPKKYVAYIAHPDTNVHPVDGSLSWPIGFTPKLISRKGCKAPAGERLVEPAVNG